MKEIHHSVSLIYPKESELLNSLYELEEFQSLHDWKKKYEALLHGYISILERETEGAGSK